MALSFSAYTAYQNEFQDNGGPWYECSGPNFMEAFELVKTHARLRKISGIPVPGWIIYKHIKNVEKSGGFGSWRGFHSFTLLDIVESSLKYYKNIYLPMWAMGKLKRCSYLKNWINHILYRYPSDKSEKIGLRVNFHRDSFNNQVNNTLENVER